MFYLISNYLFKYFMFLLKGAASSYKLKSPA